MPKDKPPYNLYVRMIANGKKISVGEYIRGKWNNAMDPFAFDDDQGFIDLAGQIAVFEKKMNRKVEIVPYGGNMIAVALIKEGMIRTAKKGGE